MLLDDHAMRWAARLCPATELIRKYKTWIWNKSLGLCDVLRRAKSGACRAYPRAVGAVDKYADNKEVFSERNKKYYEEHKDQIRETNNRWKEEHQEQYLEYQRQYHKTPKCRAKQKQYYEDNKDTIKEKQRAYREAHREEINRKKRESYHRKKKERSEASVSWSKEQ